MEQKGDPSVYLSLDAAGMMGVAQGWESLTSMSPNFFLFFTIPGLCCHFFDIDSDTPNTPHSLLGASVCLILLAGKVGGYLRQALPSSDENRYQYLLAFFEMSVLHRVTFAVFIIIA